MNEDAKKIGIPESITINGSTYVVKDNPELVAFVQEVAKVEKAKLYSQMEAIRTELNALKGVHVEGSPVDVEQLAQKLGDKFITKEDFNQAFNGLKESFPQMIKEVVQPVLTATAQQQQNELEAYRQELIQKNAATCIPDLVVGNSKEELDAALQRSIQLRSTYPAPVAEPAREQVPANAPGGQTPTPPPAAPAPKPQVPAPPRRESPAATEGLDIKGMPMSEFASRREQLAQQLEKMYGSGQN